MIARLPRELTWAFRAEYGAKVHFGHYEVRPLVPMSVFFWRELYLINRRTESVGVVREAFASVGVLPNYAVLGYGGVGDEEDGEGYVGAEGG